ncbi:MAG TPA: LTA synthase family protein, partial [Terriglobia bacterium]|nr:LTA synthase family protein [Terriglobia bacterium]
MPWILMIALHVRATWSGLTFAGLAGLGGWAVGQMFFAGLVVLFAVCARSFPKVSRFLIIPLALIAFALVLASWSTRTTGDTFHIFATEAGKTRWAMLLSSATALLDRWIVFDSILALAAVVTLFWYKPDPLRRRKAAIAATCASALVLFGARYEPKDARVESPLLALARSHGTIRPPSKLDSISDIRSLRYGSINISDLTREELRKRREVLIQEGRQPNVVLVFMESTGYRQIQPGGQWNPSLTPTLYSLSRNGVLFSSVYAPFPGTVRAHLSVMTGGKMITWGSVYDELTHRYLGPTLPGELKKRGYRTGFFSAAFLDSENMDGFYDLLPFDEKLIPERMPKDYQRQHAFNSWGIDDREVADKALAWAQKGSEPFFGVINLDATHHPYDVPGDFPSGQTDNEEARFENALHFTDYVLGRLVEGLSRSAMNDTLILVIGDHGESFGELHPGNFTHRNFIYEENVRSFLLVADVKKKLAPFTAEFPASHADVLPTTLDLLDARGDKGSLFEPKPVIEYFYKNTYPELWGLRDGQWKFIESVLPGHDSELYRLDQDPHE